MSLVTVMCYAGYLVNVESVIRKAGTVGGFLLLLIIEFVLGLHVRYPRRPHHFKRSLVQRVDIMFAFVLANA